MVVVIIELTAAVPGLRVGSTVEMRVDQPGVMVIAVSRVNVLERRQGKSRKQSETRLQRGETTHSL